MLSFKYRIYPDKEVAAKLEASLDTCRWLYNRLLQECNDAKNNGIKLKLSDTQNLMPSLKEENLRLTTVYSKALQMVNYALWGNIGALAALKKKGYKVGKLRFKKHGWYNTLNYNQSGFSLDVERSKLILSKIGEMPVKLHRNFEGNVKGLIIKRSGGKWYAIVQADSPYRVLPKTGKMVGIDLGLTSFAVDTDGHDVDSPKFLYKTYDRIKKAQKSLSRKVKGSNNRYKAGVKLIKLYDRVANQRNDFCHKLSRYYVNHYDVICVEDLDVKGLKEKGHNKGLHRNIHDASWHKFLMMLDYKAQSAGRRLVMVKPDGTTQRCSQCGILLPKRLKDREHACPDCGFSASRDYNAALNILYEGLRIAGLEQPVAPANAMPLHDVSVMQVLRMKQEAPPSREG